MGWSKLANCPNLLCSYTDQSGFWMLLVLMHQQLRLAVCSSQLSLYSWRSSFCRFCSHSSCIFCIDDLWDFLCCLFQRTGLHWCHKYSLWFCTIQISLLFFFVFPMKTVPNTSISLHIFIVWSTWLCTKCLAVRLLKTNYTRNIIDLPCIEDIVHIA